MGALGFLLYTIMKNVNDNRKFISKVLSVSVVWNLNELEGFFRALIRGEKYKDGNVDWLINIIKANYGKVSLPEIPDPFFGASAVLFEYDERYVLDIRISRSCEEHKFHPYAKVHSSITISDMVGSLLEVLLDRELCLLIKCEALPIILETYDDKTLRTIVEAYKIVAAIIEAGKTI